LAVCRRDADAALSTRRAEFHAKWQAHDQMVAAVHRREVERRKLREIELATPLLTMEGRCADCRKWGVHPLRQLWDGYLKAFCKECLRSFALKHRIAVAA
jgi:hypothetical protein